MEIREMQIEDVETRLGQIETEMTAEDADIEALSAEVDGLRERKEALRAEAEEKRAEMARVSTMTTPVIDTIEEKRENPKMEIEKREKMIDALAEYLKGRATEEQRAMLLTTNATGGTVAISSIVDNYIWTDWNDSKILSRVRKTYVRGNYKVGYEASATGAVRHTEGANAPTEETLVLAYIDFVAEYVKKWIRVSDNVLALKGQEFLDYLFAEFGHQIAMELEKEIIQEIEASTLTAQVTHALDGDAVLMGLASLSDEAENPVVIMSKATYASIKSIRTTTGARIEDPFEGLEVLFNSNATGVLVGDLAGVVVNFPEGEDFKFIVDDRSLAESDLIKIVGKILCAMHLVRPNGFALVKP